MSVGFEATFSAKGRNNEKHVIRYILLAAVICFLLNTSLAVWYLRKNKKPREMILLNYARRIVVLNEYRFILKFLDKYKFPNVFNSILVDHTLVVIYNNSCHSMKMILQFLS